MGGNRQAGCLGGCVGMGTMTGTDAEVALGGVHVHIIIIIVNNRHHCHSP